MPKLVWRCGVAIGVLMDLWGMVSLLERLKLDWGKFSAPFVEAALENVPVVFVSGE